MLLVGLLKKGLLLRPFYKWAVTSVFWAAVRPANRTYLTQTWPETNWWVDPEKKKFHNSHIFIVHLNLFFFRSNESIRFFTRIRASYLAFLRSNRTTQFWLELNLFVWWVSRIQLDSDSNLPSLNSKPLYLC